jgi:hypothetical protein
MFLKDNSHIGIYFVQLVSADQVRIFPAAAEHVWIQSYWIWCVNHESKKRVVGYAHRHSNLSLVNHNSKGLDKGGYYHDLFLRGKQFLARRIIRIWKQGTGSRKKTDSSEILPDFYVLPFLPECEPRMLPQATVQSTGRVPVKACGDESTTDSQLFLQMNILSGSFETTQERPGTPFNVPVNTSTAASLWDSFIRTQQMGPPLMCRFELEPSSTIMNRTRTSTRSPLEVFVLLQQLFTPK